MNVVDDEDDDDDDGRRANVTNAINATATAEAADMSDERPPGGASQLLPTSSPKIE